MPLQALWENACKMIFCIVCVFPQGKFRIVPQFCQYFQHLQRLVGKSRLGEDDSIRCFLLSYRCTFALRFFFFPRTAAWSPSSFFCHFCLFCPRKQPSFSLRGFWARNLATGHWGCCSLFFLLGASIYKNLLLIFGLLEIAQLRPFLRCPLAETKCVRDAWRPKTCAQN